MNSDCLSAWLAKRTTPDRPLVCIQGLGFVGAAMAAAVTTARNDIDEPFFDVIGVDLPTPEGKRRIEALNEGRFPFPTVDQNLQKAIDKAHNVQNLFATCDAEIYSLASVIVVDIPLDVDFSAQPPTCQLEGFRVSIRTIGKFASPNTLILVETTVPPGVTEKVVVPELQKAANERGFSPDSFLVAHSYERVMPGKNYLDSIINFWRVYSGVSKQAADACEEFLTTFINTEKFPLTRLSIPVASESAKIMENSYRATTIALMEEWGRFSEAANFDIFEVIDAIRIRPTHSNMRQPGFGVGGYCLTKDPLFAEIAARELYGLDQLKFPFSDLSVAINQKMPLVSVCHVENELCGIKGKRILLLGVSYRPEVADTRYSPSEVFAKESIKKGAQMVYHDPLVKIWPETGFSVLNEIPSPDGFDALVFVTSHDIYHELEIGKWLKNARPLIFDANRVLSIPQMSEASNLGCKVFSIGRGSSL